MPSKIPWTDESWNPVVGCSPCSPGCANCYASKRAHRLAAMPATREKYRGLTRKGKWTGKVRFWEKDLSKPEQLRQPRKIFVCSMGDLFHEYFFENGWENIEPVDKIYTAISNCCYRPIETEVLSGCSIQLDFEKRHTFLIITKRADNMREYFLDKMEQETAIRLSIANVCWPLKNVYLGVTVCNQEEADEKIPILLATPAAVRFVSIEPCLGPIDLKAYLFPAPAATAEGQERKQINWVILGGENGPGARSMKLNWVLDVRDQCEAAGVPFFFKGHGACRKYQKLPGMGATEAALNLNAGEFLDGLEHKEFPKARKARKGKA